jgi:hypothetical protein
MNNKDFINFYCVGVQKSGTTTLHDILKEHPQIFLPKKKEAHYFDMDNRYEKGLSWYYNEFFQEYNGEKICGSCNPDYIYFEEVPRRIFEAFGSKIKLVFIFRNPADRAFSHYLMSKRRMIETEVFEKAITLEASRIRIDYKHKSDFSYISRGYYAEQLKRYLEYFPIENMFFIRFEDDFIKNRKNTINQLLKFLEVEQYNLELNIKSNEAKTSKYPRLQNFIFNDKNPLKKSLNFSKSLKNNLKNKLEKIILSKDSNEKLEKELRKKIMSFYSDDISLLEELTGMNFNCWLPNEKK